MTVTLAPFPAEQVDLLRGWLDATHVKRWWKPQWTAPVLDAFDGGSELPDGLRPWRIDLDGRPIGYLHDHDVMQDGDAWLKVDRVGPGTRGIGLLIGEVDAVNQKHGRAAIRAITAKLFAEPGCDRIVADPHPDHWGAIIAFQKAGFRDKGRAIFPSGQVMVMAAAKAVWKP